MKATLLEILCCPTCQGKLALVDAVEADGEIQSGALECVSCERLYPIVDAIPRFVPKENYADNFGFQWNHFRKTQLDSSTGTSISAKRYRETTGWTDETLQGKLVLDVGCGAGRFAEITLNSGAELVAVDYSSAVDACRNNLNHNPNLNVVQASVYELPFKPETFDYVYCLGVLQHTPDVHASFENLVPQVKSGGEIAVDIYWNNRSRYMWPLTWMRPFTKGMEKERLFRMCQRLVKALFPLSLVVGRIPGVGRRLRHIVPVYNLEGIFPLNRQQLEEWSLLNTFDRLSATYEWPQTPTTLQAWMEEAGLVDIDVFVRPPVVGRGRKSLGT